jgi:hypothetical protein
MKILKPIWDLAHRFLIPLVFQLAKIHSMKHGSFKIIYPWLIFSTKTVSIIKVKARPCLDKKDWRGS